MSIIFLCLLLGLTPECQPKTPPEIIVSTWKSQGASRLEAEQALAVAAHESSWNPDARNPTCCAAGLFQITKGTWNGMIKGIESGRYNWPFDFHPPGYRGKYTDVELDPLLNTAIAYVIWEHDKNSGHLRGWGQWSVVNHKLERYPSISLDNPIKSIRRKGSDLETKAIEIIDFYYP